MPEPLLTVKNLIKRFPVRQGLLRPRAYKDAVSDVSFEINRGETLALVGESGSGKSTVGLILLDLLDPTSGEIVYDGLQYRKRTASERMRFRREMQVVFQDPYSSLNVRMTVLETLTEGMIIHRIGSNSSERRERAAGLLRKVGMSPDVLLRYPHEFSGGQRQRIAIARALSVEPHFIVLDEPTSALDVSVQSQVLNLLRKLQSENNLTYLFITHNLAVVEYLADNVAVMESGKIVERGTVADVFDNPKQEYTKKLLNSIPSLDPSSRKLSDMESAV
jgi:ABC-type oligopeptide transport system ATPase subunit